MNVVQGNRIGTHPDGLAASTFAFEPDSSANGDGVVVRQGAYLNSIGGAGDGEGNLIATKSGHGVALFDASTSFVLGNFIVTDLTGTNALPNGTFGGGGDGVYLGDGAAEDDIGGPLSGEGNLISGNGALGINLEVLSDPPSDVTANDPLDADGGPNGLQNLPVFATASLSSTNVLLAGQLHSTPGCSFTIELFRNAATDPSGHGEGEVFVARTNVVTDAAGNAAFSVFVPGDWSGWWFTATATDQFTGDTSEFGPATAATAAPQFVLPGWRGRSLRRAFPA